MINNTGKEVQNIKPAFLYMNALSVILFKIN